MLFEKTKQRSLEMIVRGLIGLSVARGVSEVRAYTLTQLTYSNYCGIASWSPDSSKIALSLGWGVNDRFDLYMMDRNGSNLIRLTDTPEVSESSPTWSPDGKMIAFYLNTGDPRDDEFKIIYCLDIATSNITELADAPGQLEHVSWSPNGDKMLFTTFVGGIPEFYTSKIYTLDLSTSFIRHISWGVFPKWVSDGEHFLYTSGVGMSAPPPLMYISDLKGNVQSLGCGAWPSCSHDPNYIVFSENFGISPIMAMYNDGSGREKVHDVYVFEPILSPDGTEILFTHYESDSMQFWKLSGFTKRPLITGMRVSSNGNSKVTAKVVPGYMVRMEYADNVYFTNSTKSNLGQVTSLTNHFVVPADADSRFYRILATNTNQPITIPNANALPTEDKQPFYKGVYKRRKDSLFRKGNAYRKVAR